MSLARLAPSSAPITSPDIMRPAATVSSPKTQALSSVKDQPKTNYLVDAKAITTSPPYQHHVVGAILQKLKQTDVIPHDPKLHEKLSKQDRADFRENLLFHLALSETLAKNIEKSSMGLPMTDALAYEHMLLKAVDWAIESHPGEKPKDVKDIVQLSTYYRTPVQIKELKRMGYSMDQITDIVAKAFFLEFHSGNLDDKEIFNPMVRQFYPEPSHMKTGSTDLGQETVSQMASTLAQGLQGERPPLKVIHFGDTGCFTDGFKRGMLHYIVGRERKVPQPTVLLFSANRAHISGRLPVEELIGRLKSWGLDEKDIFISSADDMTGGLDNMKQAIERAQSEGKMVAVVSHKPFRASGHASDAASDANVNLNQFRDFTNLLSKQLMDACEPGTKGADLANELSAMKAKVEAAVDKALQGDHVLTRAQMHALSRPGSDKEQPGAVVELDSKYLINPLVNKDAKLGSVVYGQAMDKLATRLKQEGRRLDYVHQENSKSKTSEPDTSGGVYRELNEISDKNLKNFDGYWPDEGFVLEKAAGSKIAFGDKVVAIAKGPHTAFNNHASSMAYYMSNRAAAEKNGKEGGMIYIVDGGSLAHDIKRAGKPNVIHAKLGSHHNLNDYRANVFADPNTLGVVPMDMNVLSAVLDDMVDLQDKGRFVYTFAPTSSFGKAHAPLPLNLPEGRTRLQANDVFKAEISGKPLSDNQELVVLTWGPEAKNIAKTLKSDEKVSAKMYIYNSIQHSKAVEKEIRQMAKANPHKRIEVLTVDSNAESGLMGPAVERVLRKNLRDLPNVHFSDCTVDATIAAYGNGEALLNSGDVRAELAALRKQSAQPQPLAPASDLSLDELAQKLKQLGIQMPPAGSAAPVASVAQTQASATTVKVPGKVIPLDAVGGVKNGSLKLEENIKEGSFVQEGDLIGEINHEKGDVEVLAPADGVVKKILKTENLQEGELFIEFETQSEQTQAATPTSVPAAKPQEKAKGPVNKIPEGAKFVSFTPAKLGTVKNMTVSSSDSKTFALGTPVNLAPLMKEAKEKGASLTALMVKKTAEAVAAYGMNKKISEDRTGFYELGNKVNIGVALDIAQTSEQDDKLRVGVVRDVLNKNEREISDEIKAMGVKLSEGGKLDTDDRDVSFVITNIGKHAPHSVDPVLPNRVTGIIAPGALDGNKSSYVTVRFDHSAVNGLSGAQMLEKGLKAMWEGKR